MPEETRTVIHGLRSGKLLGLDEIVLEMLKVEGNGRTSYGSLQYVLEVKAGASRSLVQ